MIPSAYTSSLPWIFGLFRIMIAALSFLLDFENIEDGDSDDSGSEDEPATQQPQIVVNKEALYKVSCLAQDLPFSLMWTDLKFYRVLLFISSYLVKLLFHESQIPCYLVVLL